MDRTHVSRARLALVALAVGAIVFAGDSARALSATTLKTVTTQDGTASVGLPSGWKLAKGSKGFIAITGPNAEEIDLGVLVIGKNASGGSLGGEVAFALPYSASLQDKFTTILQAGEAKSGKPPLQLSGVSASPTKLPLCSRFIGGFTAGEDSRKFEAVLCSFAPDYLGLYKNLAFLATVPAGLAQQDRPLVEEIASSYRVTPAMFKKMLAPYTALPPHMAGGGGTVAAPAFAAPYQDPTNSDCFDYNVIRQSPPWEVPMHCGGHMPG
jgi:hypothetical protein